MAHCDGVVPLTAVRSKGFMDRTQPDPRAGMFVAVRPCADKYQNKTYLGIYLGELPVSAQARFERESGVLTISPYLNPGIWVPALKQIIYGCESWWGRITGPEDIEKMEISDSDIENVWYVRAAKEMLANKQANE